MAVAGFLLLENLEMLEVQRKCSKLLKIFKGGLRSGPGEVVIFVSKML